MAFAKLMSSHRLNTTFHNFFFTASQKRTLSRTGKATLCEFNWVAQLVSDSVDHREHTTRQPHRSRIYEEGI